MYSSTKPTAVKAARSSVFQSVREATVVRGLNISRGLPARALSSAAHLSASTDRLGTAIVFVASLALLAGGTTVVVRIWATLAMIR